MLLIELWRDLPARLCLVPTLAQAHEALKPQSSLSQHPGIASIYFMPWVYKIVLLHPTKTEKALELSQSRSRKSSKVIMNTPEIQQMGQSAA